MNNVVHGDIQQIEISMIGSIIYERAISLQHKDFAVAFRVIKDYGPHFT